MIFQTRINRGHEVVEDNENTEKTYFSITKNIFILYIR